MNWETISSNYVNHANLEPNIIRPKKHFLSPTLHCRRRTFSLFAKKKKKKDSLPYPSSIAQHHARMIYRLKFLLEGKKKEETARSPTAAL